MAQMTITYVFSPNTVISSSQMNTNLVTDIRDTYNTHDTAVNGVHGVSAGAIVGTTMTQTLTNKTLTAPVISTIVNTGTLTLPTSTDTLVGRATTDTLTNKTLTSPTITTPTISSPTITTPTISSPTISGDVAFDTNTLYVDATNNKVGVGTASPPGKLTVVVDSGSGNTGTWGAESLVVTTGGASTSGGLGFGFNTGSNYGWIEAATPGSAYRNIVLNPIDGIVLVGGTSTSQPDRLQVNHSYAGGTEGIAVINTDNTVGTSNARLMAQVGGASAGDPMFLWDISGVQTWYAGVDNSDNDTLMFGTGSSVGAGTALALTTAGDASFGRDLLVTRNLTVSGSILSPTITTPTIASFTNATHNHQDAAGGGALDVAAITSGTLAVARGGTGTTSSTGTGSVVLSTSPTIVTPTIASFANANHNHQDSAGGGALSTSAITSGTFADARIAASNVTQHQTSLTIAETQITDGSVLARVGSNETISGTWTFSNEITLPTQDPPASMSTINKQSTIKAYGYMGVSGASAGTVTGYNIDGITVSSYDATITIDRDLTDGIVIATPDATSYPYLIVGAPGTTSFGLRAFVTTTGVEVVGAWTAEFILAGI